MNDKKKQSIIIIVSSLSSVLIAGRVVDRYGWIPAIIIAMLIGAAGRYILKNFKNNKKE